MDEFWVAVQIPVNPSGYFPDNCDVMKNWVRTCFSPQFKEKAPEACNVDLISL